MKNKKILKYIISTVILAAVVVLLLFVYQKAKPGAKKDAETGKSKEITVEIIIPDQKTETITWNTDAVSLKEALDEKGLIKGEESTVGYFITEVKGRAADSSKQEWWCITKGGEEVFYGVKDIILSDGDKYELTLMIGY